jgi:hypothetical protein
MSPVKITKDHPAPSPNGWVNLFTGQSVDGFLSPGSDGRSDSWRIRDSLLTNSPSNGVPRQGLLTKDTYTSFELEFDWKVASKGNPGIKYRLFYLTMVMPLDMNTNLQMMPAIPEPFAARGKGQKRSTVSCRR